MPSFPDPPMLQHYLLEHPSELCIFLALLGFVLLVAAQRSRIHKLLIAAVLTFVLAIAIYTLATLVVTTREYLANQTKKLVQAATDFNPAAINDLLHPTITLAGPDGTTWLDTDAITSQLDRLSHRNIIESQTIRTLRTNLESDSKAQTILNLRTVTQTSLGQHPLLTLWLITWRFDTASDKWLVTNVQWFDHPAPNGLKPSRSLLRAVPY